MKTSQFDAKPDEVDHWTPSSHWCAGCWHWVVDCEHLLNPLSVEHHVVDDGWIRSLAYDLTQCLRFDLNGILCTNTVRCRCKSSVKSGKHIPWTQRFKNWLWITGASGLMRCAAKEGCSYLRYGVWPRRSKGGLRRRTDVL